MMTFTPQFGDPLVTMEEDYAIAVLRLIWNVTRKTRERTLLCAAVELLPHEVPPPLERPERHLEVSGEHFVYATERVLQLQDGLKWFASAQAGRIIRPDADGAVRIGPDSPAFVTSQLDAEPSPPLLATTSRLVPFSANWQTMPRVRHLMACEFRIEQLWAAHEISAAVAWIHSDTHFDFTEFPEYWGSVHLIAPNPVFRSLTGRLDHSSGRPELVLGLDLRAGKGIDGLSYEFESKGPAGTAFVLRKRFERPIERLHLPSMPEESYERVIDSRRGLIYGFGPFVMDWSASITMNLATETRRVSMSLADGSAVDYVVSLTGGLSQTMLVGTQEVERRANARLHTGRAVRERRAQGRASQRWFRDQLRDANAELRTIVRQATDMLWVADPYFSGDDLGRVLLAVANPEVPIRVLVGAAHLRAKNDTCVEHCEHLQTRIAEAQASGRMNPLAVRVMPGSSPALHDRFLLVGKELWMLGSSLSAFGGRGSIVLKVPDPDTVVSDLEEIWRESEDFSAWMEQRRRARRT